MINLQDLQIGTSLASDYVEVFKNWHVHENVIKRLGLPYSYNTLSSKISVSVPSNTRVLYITATADSADEAKALADTEGFTVLGGGDSITATEKYHLTDRIGYICTGGGALIRFLSGEELPVVKALRHGSTLPSR